MELLLLRDIVVLILLSVLVLFVFHEIRAPAIVGLLLTGILAGPQGLGLVSGIAHVNILAEIGIVLPVGAKTYWCSAFHN